ncbi:MAG: carboxypeptidase-like regulatory domain-containing protein, partial [Bacteroidia bacterium]|nr:carboxypeptidase-like regulatory domain-containing protein [Bacteroidia bacterium]
MRNYFSLLLIIFISTFLAYPQSANGYILRGRVTDLHGDPLAGASVAIAGTYNGVQTGADGIYSFKVLKPGNYTIRYSFIGYETLSKGLTIVNDTLLDVQLKPKAVITDDVIISATRAGNQAPLAYTNVAGDIL